MNFMTPGQRLKENFPASIWGWGGGCGVKGGEEGGCEGWGNDMDYIENIR